MKYLKYESIEVACSGFFAVMLGDAKLASEFADEMLGKKILMT